MGKYTNKVDLIGEKGSVIETYDDVKTAALDLEICYSSIYQILRGDRKKTKDGYCFKWSAVQDSE